MRRGRLILLGALGALALALVPASAQATVAAGMSITFPFDAKAGDTGLPASIRVQNNNSFPEDAQTNTVCNPGDASPCTSPEPGISLVPSCKKTNGSGCAPDGADPGVFALPATALGRAASGCAGTVFDIVATGDALGTVHFVPRPAGSHVTLQTGTPCDIDFTVDVLKVPADGQEFQPGIQTIPTAEHTQFSGPDAHHKFASHPGV